MSSQMQRNEQNISLYIPHVFTNLTSEYIANIFESMGIGKINHVDLVYKINKHGVAYNSAYIHFDYWFSSIVAKNFQARVLNPKKEARIMYDDPWYWIVMENTAKKHNPGERKVRVNLTPSENITDTSVFVSELYNQKMDIQYEFKEEPQQTQDLLKNLEKENKMLKNTNQVYLNHIKKICKCVQSTEIYLENKFLNEENEERTISKKIFNILISSDTLEEAREQICKTLYKMSYQDYTNQKSIEEEISNNYSLCAQCLIWYNEGKTICDCGKCVKFD
jgi:hypothetical protein